YIAGNRLGRSGPYQHRMPVCVNQAGHQRWAAARDHGHAWLSGDRRRRDAFDDVALDEHAERPGERAVLAVEDPHILEQCRAATRRRIALRANDGCKPDAHKRKRGDENPPGYRVHRGVLPATVADLLQPLVERTGYAGRLDEA